ncbi:hypothetical protein [Rhodococcus sp. USK10]
MLDEPTSWGRVPPVIAADAGYGGSATCRRGLTDRPPDQPRRGQGLPRAPRRCGLGRGGCARGTWHCGWARPTAPFPQPTREPWHA